MHIIIVLTDNSDVIFFSVQVSITDSRLVHNYSVD